MKKSDRTVDQGTMAVIFGMFVGLVFAIPTVFIHPFLVSIPIAGIPLWGIASVRIFNVILVDASTMEAI